MENYRAEMADSMERTALLLLRFQLVTMAVIVAAAAVLTSTRAWSVWAVVGVTLAVIFGVLIEVNRHDLIRTAKRYREGL